MIFLLTNTFYHIIFWMSSKSIFVKKAAGFDTKRMRLRVRFCKKNGKIILLCRQTIFNIKNIWLIRIFS